MTLSKRLLLAFSLCGGLAFFAHPAAAALTARFSESTSLLPNGAILIAGGQTTTAASSALNEAELLMPDGTVLVTANTLSVARSSHTATVLPNGLVLIAGGINAAGTVNQTTDIYNPTTNLFTAGPSLSVPRFAHTATLLQNGTVLICGGYTDALGTVTNTCDVYTPDMSGAFGIGSIAAGPSMGTPRAFHTASLLSNGNVFIAGGLTTGGVYTQTTEIYSGSFGGGPGMSINRAFHTATTLGNGQVLIAGGANSNETSTINMGGNLVNVTLVGTAATDIYDPQSNTIAPGTPMNEARRKFSAALDANGSLNVTGGFGSIAVASDTYPSIDVNGNIAYSGPLSTFTAQSLTITNLVPPKLALSVDAAGTIVGGQAYFPPSQITFSSGTVNVSSFTVALSNQGTCIYTPGGSPTPWQCGVVQVLSLPLVSGSITCTTSPCSSPIVLTPPGGTPPLMKETAGNSTPVFVVISSMVFADEEIYNPSQNAWTLNTAALSGSNPLNASSGVPPYSFARFAHPSLLTPMDSNELIGGATWNGSSDVTQSSVLAGILSNTAPTSGPSLPGPRAYHTATTLPNGKIIIAGGQDTSADILSSSLIFDPVALTFNPTAPLNVARSGHTATLLPSGNILAAGGTNFSTGTLSSAEIYNSTGSAWTVTGSMNTPSQYHTATILSSGTVMVVGGVNGNTVLNRAEIYYSTSATWALTGALATPRYQHTATLLQNGEVLVAGGLTTVGAGPTNTAELYNPVTQSWSPAASMPVALWGHTATLLSNGTVLVAGGNSGGETTTSLLYNPNLNSWTTTAPLNTARFDHNAILLPDGGVLVSGGFTASGGAVSSVEIYIPSAQAWVTAGNMPSGKGGHTTTLSSVGTVFDIGGLGTQGGSNYLSATDQFPFSVTPDINTSGAPPSLRQPVVNAINIPVLLPGAALTITGSHFHGNTEASGGGASSANSDQNKPRMVLQAVDSGNSFLVDLTAAIYANSNPNLWTKTDSSITVQLPATSTGLPYGWYQLREAANAQFSSGLLVHAGPPLPTLAAGAPIPTILSSAAVSWSWTAAGGTPGVTFDGYDVYSATSGVFLSTVAFASTTYLEAGLAPNTTVQLLLAPYTLSGDGPGATSGISYTFAATPQSLLISSNTGSNLVLSWNPNNNSQGTVYELSESTDSFINSFSTPIPTSLAYASTQTTISNLQMDTTYYFRVRAFNSNGIPSGFSNIATTTTVDQVLNLTGSALGTTGISWSWTSPSLPPGGYFAIYNATANPESLIATTANSYFSDIGLSTNSPRSIQVSAFTSAGEGPLTSTVTVYTGAAIPAFVSPPIVAITSGGFTGQWAPNGNPASTNYQCMVTGVNLSSSVFTGFTTSSSTAQSCNISQLPLPGSFYQTQVVAINGNGVLTTPLSLGTTETTAMPPTNLAVLGTTAGSISVAWSSGTMVSSITVNSPLDFYQITYSTDDFVTDISTALAFSAQSNQSTMTISGLIGGYTYWIRAQAENQNGVLTAFSNVVTTITFNQGAPPGTLGAYVIASSQTLISGMMGNGETVSLLIPANSLSGNTFIIISTISTSPSLCPGTGSQVGFSVTANPPMEPLTPLTFSLSYFSSQIPATPANFLSQASLMRVTGTNTCVPVETQINAANNQLTAKLNHISQFELAQVTPGTGVNSAIIFPNPFYPSRGNGYVTFKNLPAGARVRLYTLRGEMVFEGTANASGLFNWPGTNRGGRLVASGVYLVEVDSNGARDIYKVAVER